MKHLYYEKYNENVYIKTLSNGLKVYLIPKPEFFKTFVTFTTKYGSIDLSFNPYGKERRVNQPAGVAHFLEHKLFANKDGSDAFERLSSYGVNANAFTSYTLTSYLFSGTENIKESLEYLLDFVQEPHFTDSNVKKEQGIIEEEIYMYFDDPSRKLYVGLMENTYKNHPLVHEILGTKESINKVTKNTLNLAYETFYHPSNMFLMVVGNFNKDEIIKIIEDNQNRKTFKKEEKIKRHFPHEQLKVVRSESFEEANINMPYAGVNVKLKPKEDIIEQYKSQFIIQMLLNIYLSQSGTDYNKLLKKGLINSSFDYGPLVVQNATSFQVSSYTNDPVEFLKEIKRILINLKRKNIEQESFLTEQRKLYGSFIRTLNSIEGITVSYMNVIPYDLHLYEVLDIINEITLDDLIEVAKEIKSFNMTTHTLLPKKV